MTDEQKQKHLEVVAWKGPITIYKSEADFRKAMKAQGIKVKTPKR